MWNYKKGEYEIIAEGEFVKLSGIEQHPRSAAYLYAIGLTVVCWCSLFACWCSLLCAGAHCLRAAHLWQPTSELLTRRQHNSI